MFLITQWGWIVVNVGDVGLLWCDIVVGQCSEMWTFCSLNVCFPTKTFIRTVWSILLYIFMLSSHFLRHTLKLCKKHLFQKHSSFGLFPSFVQSTFASVVHCTVSRVQKKSVYECRTPSLNSHRTE